jgi:hypothetical protein
MLIAADAAFEKWALETRKPGRLRSQSRPLTLAPLYTPVPDHKVDVFINLALLCRRKFFGSKFRTEVFFRRADKCCISCHHFFKSWENPISTANSAELTPFIAAIRDRKDGAVSRAASVGRKVSGFSTNCPSEFLAGQRVTNQASDQMRTFL